MLSPERKTEGAARARVDKIGARYAVIIGDDELARGVVQLRDLKTKHAARSQASDRSAIAAAAADGCAS